MTHVIGTIRKYKTRNFTVIIDAIEEDSPDLSWDDSGETQKGLDSGKYILFCARARVFLKGNEIASDYLGNCIYESLKEFKQPGYFSDMVHEVCSKARRAVQDIQLVKIRNGA